MLYGYVGVANSISGRLRAPLKWCFEIAPDYLNQRLGLWPWPFFFMNSERLSNEIRPKVSDVVFTERYWGIGLGNCWSCVGIGILVTIFAL